MKLVHWTRFSWDLTRLAPVYPAIDSHYRIRLATADDEKVVRTVVFSAFTLDQSWNFLLRDIREKLEDSLGEVFHGKQPERHEKVDRGDRLCLVVTHGSRIIGASALTMARDADNHLLTGPCILMEYRNRGLATALLAQSLLTLRDAGATTAHGLTKAASQTAQFIYSKFGSVNQPHEDEPRLAAS